MEVTRMIDMEIAVCCRIFTNLKLLFGDSPINNFKKLEVSCVFGGIHSSGYWLLL